MGLSQVSLAPLLVLLAIGFNDVQSTASAGCRYHFYSDEVSNADAPAFCARHGKELARIDTTANSLRFTRDMVFSRSRQFTAWIALKKKTPFIMGRGTSNSSCSVTNDANQVATNTEWTVGADRTVQAAFWFRTNFRATRCNWMCFKVQKSGIILRAQDADCSGTSKVICRDLSCGPSDSSTAQTTTAAQRSNSQTNERRGTPTLPDNSNGRGTPQAASSPQAQTAQRTSSSSSSSANSGSCRPNYRLVGGSYNFISAMAACTRQGLRLATFDTPEQAREIKNVMLQGGRISEAWVALKKTMQFRLTSQGSSRQRCQVLTFANFAHKLNWATGSSAVSGIHWTHRDIQINDCDDMCLRLVRYRSTVQIRDWGCNNRKNAVCMSTCDQSNSTSSTSNARSAPQTSNRPPGRSAPQAASSPQAQTAQRTSSSSSSANSAGTCAPRFQLHRGQRLTQHAAIAFCASQGQQLVRFDNPQKSTSMRSAMIALGLPNINAWVGLAKERQYVYGVRTSQQCAKMFGNYGVIKRYSKWVVGQPHTVSSLTWVNGHVFATRCDWMCFRLYGQGSRMYIKDASCTDALDVICMDTRCGQQATTTGNQASRQEAASRTDAASQTRTQESRPTSQVHSRSSSSENTAEDSVEAPAQASDAKSADQPAAQADAAPSPSRDLEAEAAAASQDQATGARGETEGAPSSSNDASASATAEEAVEPPPPPPAQSASSAESESKDAGSSSASQSTDSGSSSASQSSAQRESSSTSGASAQSSTPSSSSNGAGQFAGMTAFERRLQSMADTYVQQINSKARTIYNNLTISAFKSHYGYGNVSKITGDANVFAMDMRQVLGTLKTNGQAWRALNSTILDTRTAFTRLLIGEIQSVLAIRNRIIVEVLQRIRNTTAEMERRVRTTTVTLQRRNAAQLVTQRRACQNATNRMRSHHATQLRSCNQRVSSERAAKVRAQRQNTAAQAQIRRLRAASEAQNRTILRQRSQLTAKDRLLNETITGRRNDAARCVRQQAELRRARNSAQDQANNATAAKRRAEVRLGVSERLRRNAERRLNETQTEKAALEVRVRELTEQLNRARADNASAHDRENDCGDELIEKTRLLARKEETISTMTATITRQRTDLEKTGNAINATLTNELQNMRSQYLTASSDNQRLSTDQTRMSIVVNRLTATINDLRNNVTNLVQSNSHLTRRLNECRQGNSNLSTRANSLYVGMVNAQGQMRLVQVNISRLQTARNNTSNRIHECWNLYARLMREKVRLQESNVNLQHALIMKNASYNFERNLRNQILNQLDATRMQLLNKTNQLIYVQRTGSLSEAPRRMIMQLQMRLRTLQRQSLARCFERGYHYLAQKWKNDIIKRMFARELLTREYYLLKFSNGTGSPMMNGPSGNHHSGHHWGHGPRGGHHWGHGPMGGHHAGSSGHGPRGGWQGRHNATAGTWSRHNRTHGWGSGHGFGHHGHTGTGRNGSSVHGQSRGHGPSGRGSMTPGRHGGPGSFGSGSSSQGRPSRPGSSGRGSSSQGRPSGPGSSGRGSSSHGRPGGPGSSGRGSSSQGRPSGPGSSGSGSSSPVRPSGPGSSGSGSSSQGRPSGSAQTSNTGPHGRGPHGRGPPGRGPPGRGPHGRGPHGRGPHGRGPHGPGHRPGIHGRRPGH